MGFYLAQFLFPLAGEFGAFEEVLLYEADEVDAGVGGDECFAFFAYVVAFEECFDDGGACGGSPDAVFFECVAEFVVGYCLAGGFHGAEECGFGVGFGRLCPFFGKGGGVRSVLSLLEVGQCFLFFAFFAFVVGGGLFGGVSPAEDVAPSGFEYLFAGGFEFHFPLLGFAFGCGFFGVDFAVDGGGGELAVGVEGGDEAACHEVEDFLLVEGHVAVGGVCACGDDGVVVGDFGGVEDFFAFFQFGAHEWLDEGRVGCEALQYGGAFGVDVVAEVGGVDAGVGGEFLLVEALYVAQGFLG